MPDAPRVFISYSHDDEQHEDRVLDLANRLRTDGIDAEIDQYEMLPPEGWPAWCERQVKKADFVLLVCTETYLRRVDDEEKPGKGHGVLWEARIIRQLLYDEGSKTAKFVPVLFADNLPEHIPTSVKGAARFNVDKPDEYEALYRLLTNQPRVLKPKLGAMRALPPRERRSAVEADPPADGAAGHARPTAPAAPAEPQSRAEWVFVGREEEREVLAGLLLRPGGRRMPIVVSGMAGVGKTYLVDRVFADNRAEFPGGYVRLSVDAENLPEVATLLAEIADRLKLAGTDAVTARLMAPLTLLHLENIDTREAGKLAGKLAAACPQAALVFSARLRGLGTAGGWGQVPLVPFSKDDALAQLRIEVGEAAPHQQDWPELVAVLGSLPLALHLAAGYLAEEGGETPKSFLELLRAKGLDLEPIDPADSAFQARSKERLCATFDLSLAVLHRQGGDAGVAWEQGLLALGWAAAAGVGKSLGAAIAGLDDTAFGDMARAAVRLSLLERLSRSDGPAFRLHPLLAELGRSRADGTATIARMTEWFCARLPEPGEGEPWHWNKVHAETPALLDWLGQVPAAERLRGVRAGMAFAINIGPFHAWLRFCEAALAGELDDGERSDVLWTLGQVALSAGLPDRALAAAEEKREVDQRRGDDREMALASGLIADILQSRGEWEKALRIRREEELSVYERLGAVRLHATAMEKVAQNLSMRGEGDEALGMIRVKALPVYERFGDLYELAEELGRNAGIQGQVEAVRIRLEEIARQMLEEELKIYQEFELPFWERQGNVRSCAHAMVIIARVRSMLGDWDEALRIISEEALPLFERLGEVRDIAMAYDLIAQVLCKKGDRDEAIKILKEHVLPSDLKYERHIDAIQTRKNIAEHLLSRNRDGDRDEAHRLLCLALADARRMRISEAQQIEAFMAEHGLACDEPPAAPAP